MNCKNCGFSLSTEDKFCKNCGTPIQVSQPIYNEPVKPVEPVQQVSQPVQPVNQIYVNVSNTNATDSNVGKKKCDKWTALLLCIFFGFIGVHKFYEGKAGLGILYIFTAGLFGIGILVDLIIIITKPNPYYV